MCFFFNVAMAWEVAQLIKCFAECLSQGYYSWDEKYHDQKQLEEEGVFSFMVHQRQ